MKRTADLLAAVLLVTGAGLVVYRTSRGDSALQPGVPGARADVPLGVDATGTQYEEIHMRQGGRR